LPSGEVNRPGEYSAATANGQDRRPRALTKALILMAAPEGLHRDAAKSALHRHKRTYWYRRQAARYVRLRPGMAFIAYRIDIPCLRSHKFMPGQYALSSAGFLPPLTVSRGG
jgi:hypothetical protein